MLHLKTGECEPFEGLHHHDHTTVKTVSNFFLNKELNNFYEMYNCYLLLKRILQFQNNNLFYILHFLLTFNF